MLNQIQVDIIIKSMEPCNPIKIGIVGSVARNEEKKDSDIDILYQLKNTIGLFKLIALKHELEANLNRKVDLMAEEYVHPRIKLHVLRDLKIIYPKD